VVVQHGGAHVALAQRGHHEVRHAHQHAVHAQAAQQHQHLKLAQARAEAAGQHAGLGRLALAVGAPRVTVRTDVVRDTCQRVRAACSAV
jgi:hypothetical protein